MMTPAQLSALLIELLAQPMESEWLEFKHNNSSPEMIAETLSALANAAALRGRDMAYMVWGIEDGTHKVVGTTFKPRMEKKGNEELENWLMRSLHPQIHFKIHEFTHDGHVVVLIEIPRASHAPIRFGSEEFVRVGGLTKKLKDYPTKEADLWAVFSRKPFETSIAKADQSGDEVLSLIDVAACFESLGIPLPSGREGFLSRLVEEKLVVPKPGGRFDITNLGAILFAKNLNSFDRLGRKAIRVIKYRGTGRIETEREWRDPPSQKGYAVAYEAAIAFINSQLPHNEPIGQAFRTEVRMYPEKAIRELVANALIHQDFFVTGAGPMVEIFEDRMEITNPGEPLVDTLRFIDTPPRSRNDTLAAMMRRMKICEEGGTGIDKVVAAVELFQLPAPNFITPPGFTRATLFAYKKLSEMDKDDRTRACYQHACLCFVSNLPMSNDSLRKRFSISDKNYPMASRILRDTVAEGLIKPHDPTSKSRKHARYIPFWA